MVEFHRFHLLLSVLSYFLLYQLEVANQLESYFLSFLLASHHLPFLRRVNNTPFISLPFKEACYPI